MSKRVTISPKEAADRLAIREHVEAYANCPDRGGVLPKARDHSVEQLAQEENELQVGLIPLRVQQGKALEVEEHVCLE